MSGHVLLITGAGASRNLVDSGSQPLLLMNEWTPDLVNRLNQRNPMLASVIGLTKPQLDGEGFERCLGAFLAWQRMLPDEQFSVLGEKSLDENDKGNRVFPEWLHLARQRAEDIVDAIFDSLYENFGEERVSPNVASDSYAQLLTQMEADVLTVATTNYDSSVIEGLQSLGRSPFWGEAARTRIAGGSPPVTIQGLAETASPHHDAILYLHGKIGWYWKDQALVAIDAKQYNKEFGLPGILLPEQKKNYAQTGFDVMWDEFRQSVERANRILVLGHSLHDEGIVELLRPKVQTTRVVGWTADPGKEWEQAEYDLRDRLPGVRCLRWNFGAESPTDANLSNGFKVWRDGQ